MHICQYSGEGCHHSYYYQVPTNYFVFKVGIDVPARVTDVHSVFVNNLLQTVLRNDTEVYGFCGKIE